MLKVRRRTPPEGLTVEQWWAGMWVSRKSCCSRACGPWAGSGRKRGQVLVVGRDCRGSLSPGRDGQAFPLPCGRRLDGADLTVCLILLRRVSSRLACVRGRGGCIFWAGVRWVKALV